MQLGGADAGDVIVCGFGVGVVLERVALGAFVIRTNARRWIVDCLHLEVERGLERNFVELGPQPSGEVVRGVIPDGARWR